MDHKRAGSEPTTISRVAEAEIPADLMHQVQALMQMYFPGYPNRAYFKLRPISVTWRWRAVNWRAR
jgi:hypothetical protein